MSATEAKPMGPMGGMGLMQTSGPTYREGALARHPVPVTAPQILIPKLGKEIPLRDWYWKELRDGGMLANYLAREKSMSRVRMRAVAKKNQGFKQSTKTDLELKAVVPAREYFRWRAVDPHFWEDNNNLKGFLRDNPEAKPAR